MMSSEHLLTDLNPQQRQAVTAEPSNLLILAGAGSGKTRVIVHRIAWLMTVEGVSPYSVLAVTFTNKAASEMRARIESLFHQPLSGMWVGTFHGLSHQLLRRHWEAAKLPETFQIIDSDDQLRLVRRIHKELELDDTKWPVKRSQWFIGHCKEQGKRAKDIEDRDFFEETMHRIYARYEALCENNGLVDFGELLLRTVELLRDNADVATHYQERFRHLLVDEFQDTNAIQYEWLQLLKGHDANIVAVGDDDQSIYSWRGAKVENIHRFEKDFPSVHTIRLEQNYRSTSNILNAANAVIEHNDNRLGKKLWTDGLEGDKVQVYSAFNERDEAYYIISQIKTQFDRGYAYKDMAILYRSNAQSRIFEEKLIDARIPYRIYGGLRFYERAEIKDALAYMRLISNRHDDASLERVINTPTRGIGLTTVAHLREEAKGSGVSLWQAAYHLLEHKTLNPRSLQCLQHFLELIDTMDAQTRDMHLHEQTEFVLNTSGLLSHYKKDKTEKGTAKVENLEEFVSATKEFCIDPSDEVNEEVTPLSAFLSHVALESGDGQAEEHTDCVALMTLHASKGLEFPIVYIGGLEENVFPSQMSMEEPGRLEEERRLCYVGMTRAKEKLVLCHAEMRQVHGKSRYHAPSRFIKEMPDEYTEAIRPTARSARINPEYAKFTFSTKSAKQVYASPKKSLPTGHQVTESGLKIGQRVSHKKFGTGVILNYEGAGDNARIQVKFDKAGVKWLMAGIAKLDTVS